MQGQHLNWGIAAAGRITQDFVTALDTIEGSGRHAVVAVADVEGERAQEFAQRNQIPRHYDGFDALAQDREVNVVYVGTLNPFHYAVVRLMLTRDKHVLCETPLCLGLPQAKELYALAEQRGLFLMEGESKEYTTLVIGSHTLCPQACGVASFPATIACVSCCLPMQLAR